MKNLVLLLLAFICCSCLDTAELGNGYFCMNAHIYKKIKLGKYDALRIIVPLEVLNYECDEHFIIAYQRPAYEDDTVKPEERDSIYAQVEQMLSIRDCYWIIQKDSDHVWGPLTKTDFDGMCARLGVKAMLNPKYEKSPLNATFSDTILWGRFVPAELVHEGFKEKEYYMTLGGDSLSTFSCIFGVQDYYVKYARITFNDSSKSCFAHVASDSAMLNTPEKEYGFFLLSYPQLVSAFSRSMKTVWNERSLSTLTIDMAYLGDETINISVAYHAQTEVTPDNSLEEVMADVIRESRLYKDLNAVLNEHHLKIGGVSVEEIVNIDSVFFARSNIVTTNIPHEITACTAHFSILPE